MTFQQSQIVGAGNQSNWDFLASYFIVGKGAPEGLVKARIGAIFLRIDGEEGKVLYVKKSGEGTTEGWVSVQAATTATKELFLQLAVVANRKVAFGEAEVEFGGASIEATKVITHGLGATPIFAAPIFEDAGYVPGGAEYGATTFKAKAQKRDGTIPGAGTKGKFHWLAIG